MAYHVKNTQMVCNDNSVKIIQNKVTRPVGAEDDK